MSQTPVHRLRRAGISLGIGLALVALLFMTTVGLQPAVARSNSVRVVDPGAIPAINAQPTVHSAETSSFIPLVASDPSCYSVITVTNDTPSEYPSISDDGDYITFIKQNEVYSTATSSLPSNPAKFGGSVSGSPASNADGTRIAFHSNDNSLGADNSDGNYEIFVWAEGGVYTQVTSTTGTIGSFNLYPDINNNGQYITFVSNHDLEPGKNGDHNPEIFLADIDSGGQPVIIQITNSTGGGVAQSEQPAISGDGTRIVFVSTDDPKGDNPDNNPEIFLADINSGGQTVITQVTKTGSGKTNDQPAINDDGTRIVFVSDDDLDGNNNGHNPEIFLAEIGPDGQPEFTQVTKTGSGKTNDQPSISGDGLRAAFRRNKGGDGFDIYVAAFDLPGITIEKVTKTGNSVTNKQPSINKFGSHIAFVSDREDDNSDKIFLAECGLIDLVVTKSAMPDPAKIHHPLTYTILITNEGPSAAQVLTLTDILPKFGIDFNEIITPAGGPLKCAHTSGTISCTLRSERILTNTATTTVTVRITPTQLGFITNTVSVTSTQTDRQRPNNDPSPFVTEVRSVAKLTVTKTVVPTTTGKNEPITYTITITNTGPFTATDVTLKDTLPAGIFPQTIFTDDINNNFGGADSLNNVITSGDLLQLTSGSDITLGQYIRKTKEISSPVNWNRIAWVPQRPLYKELPDNRRSEGGYSEGNIDDMSHNTLLLHFNFNGYSFNAPDSSGNGHDGRCYYYYYYGYYDSQIPCSSREDDGRFNDAVNLFQYGYSGYYVDTDLKINQGSSNNKATMMAWVYPTSTSFGRHHVISTDDGGFDWSLLREGNTWYVFTGEGSRSTGFPVDLNQWQHVAAVFGSDSVKFYKNGQSVTLPFIGYDSLNNAVSIGTNPGFRGEYFAGKIDEAAIFDDELDDQRLEDHYLRGALRLKLKVRSCDTSDCTGKPFIGPDGEIGSFYSELDNNTATPPSFPLKDVDSATHFQYQVEFERDADVHVPSVPALESVSITRDDFGALIFTPDSLSCQKGSTVICSFEYGIISGTTKTVTIQGIARTAAPIVNTVNVTSTAYKENEDDPISEFSTVETKVSEVDLTISKFAPSSVLAGANLIYTIIITNTGDPDGPIAADVVITDTLSDKAFDDDFSVPAGCEKEGGNQVVCKFEEIPADSAEMVTFAIRPTESGAFINEVKVTAVNPDPTPPNVFTVSTTVISATDLIVNKSASAETATAGEPLTYTLTVKNNGPMDVGTVTLTDTVVADIPIALGSINPTSGICIPGGSQVINCDFDLGSLAKNDVVTITMVITPSAEGVITNTVSVTTSDLADHNPSNNTDIDIVGGSSGVLLPIILKNSN